MTWSLSVSTAAGNRIVVGYTDFHPLWPEDEFTDSTILSWFDIGSAPLATTPATTARFASVGVTRVLAYPDRAQVLGGSTAMMTSSVVWLNAGSP